MTKNAIYETRRSNLHKLIERYDGPTNLARRLRHNGTSYISQLSKGRRPITEQTAREIEKELNLPHRWFDGGGENPQAASPAAAIDMEKFRDTLARVEAALEAEGRRMSPERRADLIAYVYKQAVRGAAVDVRELIRFAGA